MMINNQVKYIWDNNGWRYVKLAYNARKTLLEHLKIEGKNLFKDILWKFMVVKFHLLHIS